MTAIALDELVIQHRDGGQYPVMLLKDAAGSWVELFVRENPREAFIRLSQLGQATSLMQAEMPPTSFTSGSFDSQGQ